MASSWAGQSEPNVSSDGMSRYSSTFDLTSVTVDPINILLYSPRFPFTGSHSKETGMKVELEPVPDTGSGSYIRLRPSRF